MNKDHLLAAVNALKRGEVIVYPTDTLYALGVDIFNKDAVKKIFTLKNRPFSVPLPVAVANAHEIENIAYTNDIVKKIVKQFLPGMLTLLLKKKECVPSIVTSDEDTIAVRIPDNEIALDLLEEFGPLTVTSANIHGKKTSHVIKDIQMQFRTAVSVYLDDGLLDGEASTIVDLTTKKPRIVRPGPITEQELLDAI